MNSISYQNNTTCTALAVVCPQLNQSISKLFKNYLDLRRDQLYTLTMNIKDNAISASKLRRESVIRNIVLERRKTRRFWLVPSNVLAEIAGLIPSKKLEITLPDEKNNPFGTDRLDLTEKEIYQNALRAAFV